MKAAESKSVNTWGVRRRFKGKMVGPGGSPRSSSKVNTPSKVSFECGQVVPVSTKFIPAQYKVSMPRNHVRYVRERV